jgi:23S rRNA maturation mini-RNase III
VETLFGYLYLMGEHQRIEALFAAIVKEADHHDPR